MYIFQPERYLLEQQIKKYAGRVAGDILDVGAGRISRYRHLFSCRKYIAMDAVSGDGIDVVGRAEAIPFPDGSFDGIICTQVLGDIEYPAAAMREFFRVLREGGCVLLTESFFGELHDEPRDYWRFTKFGLQKMFAEVGFREITIDRRGGYFSVLAQCRIRYCIDRMRLYRRPLLGKAASFLFRIYGRWMIWLDSLDRSDANGKYALGWCVCAKK